LQQITKQIVKVNGETVFTATLTVTNEYGDVRVLAYVATKSHAQYESALLKMKASLEMYGHAQPMIFYTDNPAADKQFLEQMFPSLKADVVPVEIYPMLKQLELPDEIGVSPQSSASGIEEALAKITDDLNVEDETSSIVVGFDAEWNVDTTKRGTTRPTAVIQIAYGKWVHIFQIARFNGKLPSALKSFLQNPQILKAGRNVSQDLKRLQNECNSQIPFVGGVELANLAKARGVISDARAGLAHICAAVLHACLDKPTDLRVSSNWDNDVLSSEQLQYAALDAWASLQIYHQLSQFALPEVITDSAPPGTPVSIRQDDGQIIAHGILSLEQHEKRCRDVNHSSSRSRVTIHHVIIPAAILPLHSVSLASLGPAPFDVLVKRSKVFSHPQNQDTPPIPPSSSTSTQPNHSLSEDLLQFLSKPVSAEENWTVDIDKPTDATEDADDDISGAEPDRLTLAEGLALLREIESNPSAWPAAIRSRVLMDIWHAMARIKISKEHGFRRPFARALRDAMLIPDATDKKCISDYLISIGSSWAEMLQFNAKWLWKRCKRIIPPPEQLYPLVKEVYTTFGPLLDAKTRKPLFNSRAWKDAGNVLKAIRAGLLSDPPGIPLYFQMGVDKKHGNLPIYRCTRETNSAEGGVHHSGRRQLPISGVSACHASSRL